MPSQTFKVGEMLNKRTPNSKTWLNFDGSYTADIYSGIVHYQDVNGNLQNINTDLYDEADFDQIDFPVAKDGDSLFYEAKEKSISDKKKNRLDREKFDFQGLQVPFDCKIPRNIKRGYSIGKGQSKLTFIPVGSSSSRGYVEGNKITYPDVWNDADVVLEVTEIGIKETIILKSERAPFHLSFEVQGELSEELKIQPPWLQDANGVKRDVVQGVYEEDTKTFIDLVADVSSLVYPIEIDPTVVIGGSGSGVTKDTYANVYNPTGGAPTAPSLLLSSGTNGITETIGYISFDLSTISGVASAATLTVRKQANSNAFNMNCDVYYALTNWTEAGLTWNTKPNVGARLNSFSVSASAGEYDVPITGVESYVNAYMGQADNPGLALYPNTPNYGQSNSFNIYSKEATTTSYKPKLTVVYNLPPTAPVVTAPNGGETWNSSQTITWNAATDPSAVGTLQGSVYANLMVGSGASNEIGQTFTMTVDGYINKIYWYAGSGASPMVGVKLELTGESSGSSNGVVYASKTDPIRNAGLFLEYALPTPYKAVAGEKVVVRVVRVSSMVDMTGSTSDVYTGGSCYYKNTSNSLTTYPTYDANAKIDYDEAVPQNQLRYQIQLTTDGSTWSDIIALTAAGAVSYIYDFINKPQTSIAKIRIRAYDGSAYGPWDESNGVFTIQHNTAPTAPTNMTPTGAIDRVLVQRLSWKHNDPEADAQSKFDLQWRKQGDIPWNTVTQSVVNQYWDAPISAFPKGTIEWQVRTYDQAGLSGPYSATGTFIAGDKPATPTITTPGSTVSVANPTVQWSSVDQTGYSLNVKNSNSVSVFSVDRNSTNKAETISYNLANQQNYTIEFKTKNTDGLYSDLVTKSIAVSYTPPAIPVIETAKGNSYIQLNITDPVPLGTQPPVLYHEIYKEIDGSFVLIAENVQSNFKDFHTSSDETVQYFVRTIGSNGTFSDTLTFSNSISFKGVWLHLVEDPVNTIKNFRIDGSGRSSKWSLENAVHQFQGRKNPVLETGEMSSFSVDFNLQILNIEEHQALEGILYSQQTVCYRDGRGRKVFGVFVDVPFTDERWGYSTSLSLMKIDFKEEIE